jgi:hypothetical protein
MKINHFRLLAKNKVSILMLIGFFVISFQIGAAHEIRKYSINNGAIDANSSRFRLKASIAQVDAGATMAPIMRSSQTGIANVEITPGFWQQNTDLIFTDEFE